LADVVKFVEKPIDQNMQFEYLNIQPKNLYTNILNVETFVYQNLAFDVYQNRIKKVIFF